MIVNGVSVEVEKCSHAGCHVEPTEEDIQRAVNEAQQIKECSQWCCAYCGKSVNTISYKVYHYDQGWVAMERETEPSVSLRIQPQNDCEVAQLLEECDKTIQFEANQKSEEAR